MGRPNGRTLSPGGIGLISGWRGLDPSIYIRTFTYQITGSVLQAYSSKVSLRVAALVFAGTFATRCTNVGYGETLPHASSPANGRARTKLTFAGRSLNWPGFVSKRCGSRRSVWPCQHGSELDILLDDKRGNGLNDMKPPRLKSSRFIIRAFEKGDLSEFTEYRSKEEISRYQSWSDYSYSDAVDFFNGMDYLNFGSVGNWYQLAISSIDNNTLMGDIAMHFLDEDQIEVGFTISPSFQNRNIATEALSMVLKYVFCDLKKHRVVAITDTRNTASIKLLEKLRFRREGHFIKNVFFKGAWGDEYQYALLRSEIKLR